MPMSMTGFGRLETNAEDFSHVWEIRSVNNRFLDVKWRMPSVLRSLETRFDKLLRKSASRGRVDISLFRGDPQRRALGREPEHGPGRSHAGPVARPGR